MCVTRNEDRGYFLDQEEAIVDLLRDHGMTDANSSRAPIGTDVYEVQCADSGQLADTGVPGQPSVRAFQSIVESLLWVARRTRPGIAFAVHKATRQTHEPRIHDWKLAKRIVRYLSSTRGLKISMKPAVEETAQPVLMSYSDADYAADKANRKSLTGSVIMLNGMIISWCSKKQEGVALSTMELEFVAASESGRKLFGVRETLSEIGELPALLMKMLIDNQAAIRQIEGEVSSTKAKHIDVRVKYLCDYAHQGIVMPQHVPSDLMLANVLIKALDAVKTVKFRSLLHVV
uniref:Uncharacterized protein n=1 Tax=Peronospora matthiolae TaxID=2874970 RepID=A0AAV1T135_9STRA